jgi:CheY-like chemotaxis protein
VDQKRRDGFWLSDGDRRPRRLIASARSILTRRYILELQSWEHHEMPNRRFKMLHRKNNVLIVEDDSQLRLLLTAILTQAGYRVRSAEDGFSALMRIRADVPDIILSDLYMLGMSGFELLSVVRRRFPEVTVIAMSSAFSDGQIPAGVAADAFYQKATGVPPLLTLLEESAAVEDLTQRYRGLAPIWIATHPPKSGTEAHVVIACPECLRTSSCVPGDASLIVRKTDCAYCGTPIDYAIVQTTDPGPPKELWRQPSRQAAARSLALD